MRTEPKNKLYKVNKEPHKQIYIDLLEIMEIIDRDLLIDAMTFAQLRLATETEESIRTFHDDWENTPAPIRKAVTKALNNLHALHPKNEDV